MRQRDIVDHLIRSTLQTEVGPQEPSPSVRDSLLAAVARDNVTRSALGPTIPPLAEGLLDSSEKALALEEQVTTVIPLARRQLLLLAAPLYAVR